MYVGKCQMCLMYVDKCQTCLMHVGKCQTCLMCVRSGQTKDYQIGICCFSAKHAALRRNSTDWLVRNKANMSEWGDMSIRGLLFQ
jgi:hypothetical protein